MSSIEVFEMSALAMGNFLTTFSVFLSIATAYLAAAYVVGAKLTTLQLCIVNGSYLIATTILGYLVVSNFRVFFIWASSNPDGLVRQSGRAPVLVDFTWSLSILLLIIVLGSFTFMYSIRKGEAGESEK